MKFWVKNGLGALALAFALLLGVGVSSALAFPGGYPGGYDGYYGKNGSYGADRSDKFWKRIGLSDEQRARIDKIRADGAADREKRDKELFDTSRAFHDELLKNSPERAKLDRLKAKLVELSTERTSKRLDERIATMSVLTPEQRDKLKRFGYSKRSRPWRDDRYGQPGAKKSKSARPNDMDGN